MVYSVTCRYCWYRFDTRYKGLPADQQTEAERERTQTWLIYAAVTSAITVTVRLKSQNMCPQIHSSITGKSVISPIHIYIYMTRFFVFQLVLLLVLLIMRKRIQLVSGSVLYKSSKGLPGFVSCKSSSLTIYCHLHACYI